MSSNKLRKLFRKNRGRVKEVFDRPGVVVAYLFGSGSEKGGEMGALSDLDFGVSLEESLSREEKADLYLEILNELLPILGEEIDLVLMNDADLLMRFNVIKTGEVLFQRSVKEKVLLETDIIRRYLDTKYYRERHVEERIKKMAERGFE